MLANKGNTEIYLDNAATTRCDEDAAKACLAAMLEDYGNPSSLHRKGFEAEELLKEARAKVALTIAATPDEIVFTSGGTEADNMALFGAARAYRRRGRHIISTQVEHPAVARVLDALEEEGFSVTRLPVDSYGLVDPETAARAVQDDTILLSVMAVNNEVGAIQDLLGIGGAVKDKKPDVLFHTDAVQGYGKIPMDVRKLGVDLLAASGHKFHAPKGTGFLYVKKGTRLSPIIRGGGQQWGLLSGTENVPGAVALSVAAAKARDCREEFSENAAALRDGFVRRVRELLPGVVINGPAGNPVKRESAAPHIISLTIKGLRSEVLLHALEERGIYVSSGSACSSHAPKKNSTSVTLAAMGIDKEAADSTIRISFSRFTTARELECAFAALGELVPTLSRFK